MAPRILLIGPVGAALALYGLTAEPASLSLAVSNPSCAASVPRLNRCSIKLRSIYAAASDTPFTRIEIAIGGTMRVVETGFFESSGYFSSNMIPDGLSVTCGIDGEGGAAGFGRIYYVSVNAYFFGASPIQDSAAVICPPASDHIFGDGFEPGGAG